MFITQLNLKDNQWFDRKLEVDLNVHYPIEFKGQPMRLVHCAQGSTFDYLNMI